MILHKEIERPVRQSLRPDSHRLSRESVFKNCDACPSQGQRQVDYKAHSHACADIIGSTTDH